MYCEHPSLPGLSMTTYDNGEGSMDGMEKLQMRLPDETMLTWKEDQEVVSGLRMTKSQEPRPIFNCACKDLGA